MNYEFDENDNVFDTLHIERTPDYLMIKSARPGEITEKHMLVLSFCMAVVTALALSRYVSSLPFYFGAAWLGFFMLLMMLQPKPPEPRYRLKFSGSLIEFNHHEAIDTRKKPLMKVELRRSGQDINEYSVFTLWLIFMGDEMPTLQHLTKEEGQYLTKIIGSYMQLGDELFYPAGMEDHQKSKREG